MKINNEKILYTKISPEEYLSFYQLIDTKIEIFILEICDTLNSFTPEYKEHYKHIWSDVFNIALFELKKEDDVEKMKNIYFRFDDIVTKINSLYFELCIIVPKYFMDNLRYNFYSTLLNDYKIDKYIINFMVAQQPHLFLIHLIGKKWWNNIKLLNS